MTPTDGKPGRRRGQELQEALLDAAWAELTTGGYPAFTIDGVAQRAGTSRAVLYRRWKTREELAQAAMVHAVRRAGPRSVPDTGSLRGDVIAVLREANETRASFAAVLSVQLGAFYTATGTTIADLRARIVADEPEPAMDTILRRAADRGEIDLAGLTPRMANVPGDLFRHEIMVTLQPLPDPAIEEIVDIFLRLVGARKPSS